MIDSKVSNFLCAAFADDFDVAVFNSLFEVSLDLGRHEFSPLFLFGTGIDNKDRQWIVGIL